MTLIQGKYHKAAKATIFAVSPKLTGVIGGGARGGEDKGRGPGACPACPTTIWPCACPDGPGDGDRARASPAPTSRPNPTAGMIHGKSTVVYQGKTCEEQASTTPISSNIAASILMRPRLHSCHTTSATPPTMIASSTSSRRTAIWSC